MRHIIVAVAVLSMMMTSCRPSAEEPPRSGSSVQPTDQGAATVDSPTLAAGDHTFTLRHDRRTRSYIVHVPPRLAASPPVLVALHGGGGTGAGFQEQNGIDAIADREGFVVLYPEGTGIFPNRLHTWNSGDTCCGYALDRGVDDVGFLRGVLDDLDERVTIDADRIYVTGHSNGAMMAYRFAVEASDVVAAIAPVGGAIDLAEPDPTSSVALLHIHSADDPRALYDGGDGPPFPGTDRVIHHEPVLPGIQAWAAANGCSPSSEQVEAGAGTGPDRDHRYERFVWSECDNGVAVEHLLLHGTGHGWPGVTVPHVFQQHLGPPTSIVDASEEVWKFVSRFTR